MAGHPGRRGRAGADPAGRAGDAASGPDVSSGSDATPDPGEEALAARLAEIWAMVAEANPELAKRLPGYLTAAD